MPSRTIKPLACCLFAAALFASGAAQANLVTNGGFETGGFDGWTQSIDPMWDSVNASIPVPEGNWLASFGGAGSSISQTLATVAGGKYKVSFLLELEGDVNSDVSPNAFSFDFGPYSGLSISDSTAFDFKLVEVSFIAAGASTDLTFHFDQGPGFWDLDAVTVSVPEPGSLALLAAAGLSGVAATRRRKSAAPQA